MEEKQGPFCPEEQKMLQELLGNVKELIRDSDAAAEKEMVKDFLQQVSEAVTFVAAGDSASGKTGLLKEKVKGLIRKSDVLLVLFDASRIRSFSVWEFLEDVERRKMVFVDCGTGKTETEHGAAAERNYRLSVRKCIERKPELLHQLRTYGR